jgi:two-component system CheB/CheR fusion protein
MAKKSRKLPRAAAKAKAKAPPAKSAGNKALRARAKRGKAAGVSPRAPRRVAARPTATTAAGRPGRDRRDPPGAPEATSANAPGFLVVGIGASAGGLEALMHLLHGIPTDIGAAFVVVQHMAAKQESLLPGLLAANARLPVVQVSDGMPLEPNRVHVIPPDSEMGVAEGRLLLVPRGDDRRKFMPVDFFFRSLAEYARSQSIGVILSGTASDGALGLKEIKGVGGITIAQEPGTARYDGMPRAAIATGAVDLVLPPEGITRELVRIARHPLVQPGETRRTDVPLAGDEHLGKIFTLLRSATGVDFTHYKQPTIRRRLQRRLVLHKLHALDQYVAYLRQNPAEVQALYRDILINVTRFFREPESFDVMREKVFPRVLQRRGADEPIRVWVPGCSTGEEAYSIAIALLEYIGDRGQAADVQIFATDISETAVDHARAGVYPESIAADVSPERLRQFFMKIDGSYRINKTVRDMCVFARQDLTRDPPFSRLDLVVCRNVLIYLGPVLQKKLMNVFHYAIRPDGFLMLGSAETAGPHSDLFTTADKKFRLYTKKAAVARADLGFQHPPDPRGLDRPGPGRRGPAAPEPRGSAVQNEATRVILARYAPPAVIVDADYQIVQFRGQTGAYLEPAPGDASLNLLKMAREGLLYALRTALHEARGRGIAVRKERLRVKSNGHLRDVNLEVVPIQLTGEARHFLVLFEDTTVRPTPAPAPDPRHAAPGKAERRRRGDEGRVARLEEELAASREFLQSIIQDLEATNEELQSANEEILSSNEELQSTNEELDTAKEELQSTNEELNTLNDELHGRNEELNRVNSDLVNLLASVQIAIVMVSADLKIRRFTPTAERVLNLIPGDVGRPITDIKPNIDCPDLGQLIADAIDTVSVKERDVRDRSGRRFTLRIRPYKNMENKIEGAILALLDTAGPAADVRALFDTFRRPLLVLDPDLTVRTANKAYLEVFRTTARETEGRLLYVVGNRRWNLPELTTLLRDVLPREQFFEEFRVDGDVPEVGRRTMRLSARRVEGDARRPALILLEIEDVTDAGPTERAHPTERAGPIPPSAARLDGDGERNRERDREGNGDGDRGNGKE